MASAPFIVETVVLAVTGYREDTGFYVTGQVVFSGFSGYPAPMDLGTDYGTNGHVNDVSGHAPGDLELVRSFVSLHDHAEGARSSIPPSTETIEAWLRGHGLLQDGASPSDLIWAGAVLDDLRLKARGESTPEATDRLNAAAGSADLTICFGCTDDDPIHAGAPGVRGAVGRLLGIAFLSELDGSFRRLRGCANDECRDVFWDRSKNRTGKWCSMDTCGNQAKVRAFRERERASAG